jgi:mRNA interferase RelE/StbE
VYGVQLLDVATKQLQRLDPAVARRIVARIRWLAEHLDEIDRVPLAGDLAGLFKLRVGDYRVVHEVLHDDLLIIVHFIGHRRDVYRRR